MEGPGAMIASFALGAPFFFIPARQLPRRPQGGRRIDLNLAYLVAAISPPVRSFGIPVLRASQACPSTRSVPQFYRALMCSSHYSRSSGGSSSKGFVVRSSLAAAAAAPAAAVPAAACSLFSLLYIQSVVV